jgi:SAM-dependent methyltransferase
MPDHTSRVAAEIEIYRKQINIHDLPDIFHYWSVKFLRPHLQAVFGLDDLHAIFAAELQASLTASKNTRILSIGSGDGCVEIAIAKRMRASGFADFRFHCLELNPHLIARGKAAAADADLGEHVKFEAADLSHWRAQHNYGAVFAHHSLHHIEALEHVFDQVRNAMLAPAAFVTADMIGRNGHMRWPETLAPLERVWSSMPERHKFNHQFQRVVDPFENWDCSAQSFEGIRAQDIMPTLIERFHFEKLCVWGGMLDVLIDRGYGHNLSRDNPADAAFVDTLWEADCAMLRLGAFTPTQMVAVMRKQPVAPLRSSFGLTPQQCVRYP